MTWVIVVIVAVAAWRLVAALSRANEPRELEPDVQPPRAGRIPDLLPWMHRQRFLAALTAGGDEFHVVELGSAWAGVAAQHQKDGPIPLPGAIAEKIGQTPEGLWAAAVEALKAKPFELESLAPGLYAARKGDGLDPARLLCTERIQALGFKGHPVAIAPSDRLLLVADGGDDAALRALLDAAVPAYAGEEWRTLEALELVDGEWQDFELPSRHPLAAAFRAARARSVSQEFADVMSHVRKKGGPPAARVAALPESAGGELVATWVKGTSVLLPRCDRVVLIDPEAAGADRRVELTWDTFTGCFGWMLADERLAYRTRNGAFPTVHERAFARRAQPSFAPSYDASVLPPATRADLDRALTEKGGYLLSASGALLPDGREVPLTSEEALALAKRLTPEDLTHLEMEVLAESLFAAAAKAAADAEEEGDDEEDADEHEGEGEDDEDEDEDEDDDDDDEEDDDDHGAASDEGEALAKRAMGLLSGPMGFEERGRLMPVLRPAGYREATRVKHKAMLAANGHGVVDILEQEPLCWPMANGIELELVIDHGHMMAPLSSAMAAGGYGEELKRTALANLEGASALPMKELVPGAYQAEWTDGFRASRLLLPGLVEGLAVKGTPIAFTATYDSLVVAGLDDLPALTAALEAAEKAVVQEQYAFREALTAQPWKLENGAWVAWQLPASHPLASRVAALQRRLEEQGKASVQALASIVPQALVPNRRPAQA